MAAVDAPNAVIATSAPMTLVNLFIYISEISY
jgi:hypothetical protein